MNVKWSEVYDKTIDEEGINSVAFLINHIKKSFYSISNQFIDSKLIDIEKNRNLCKSFKKTIENKKAAHFCEAVREP